MIVANNDDDCIDDCKPSSLSLLSFASILLPFAKHKKREQPVSTHTRNVIVTLLDAFVCVNGSSVRSAFDAILCCCRTRITDAPPSYRSATRFGLLFIKVIVFSHTWAPILLVVFVALKCSSNIERKENNEQQLAGRALNTFKCALNK